MNVNYVNDLSSFRPAPIAFAPSAPISFELLIIIILYESYKYKIKNYLIESLQNIKIVY